MSMRFTANQLNPRMRAQLLAKLPVGQVTTGRHSNPEAAKSLRAKESGLEATLALHLRGAGIEFVREHRPFHDRKHRIDFALLPAKIAIECEGGIWIQGRHQRGQGFIDDAEKYNRLAIEGWLLLRFAGGHIKSGEALRMIEKAILSRK